MKRRRLAEYLASATLPDEIRAEIRGILRDNKTILPGWSPTFLRSLGEVKTIIDVGVLNGTPALYKAFPQAWLILVEALPMYEDRCRQILADRQGGEIHLCAVGASDGTALIRHYPEFPATSSLLMTSEPNGLRVEEIEVPLRCLDNLLAGSNLAQDILLKSDVEGMELEVLRGAMKMLPDIKFIISETSIRQRHRSSYRFADLVCFLAEQGFDLYDVLRVTRTKALQPEASIMDAVFVNRALHVP